MKTWIKWALVAVPGTILGMLLNPNAPLGALLWPLGAGGPSPTAQQLPFLMALDLVQAAAFGFGLAFLAFGYGFIRRVATTPAMTTLVYLSLAWGLVSWVPHIAMHASMGGIATSADFWGLIAIDYAFHLTGLAAIVILALFVLRLAMPGRGTPKAVGAAAAATVGQLSTTTTRPKSGA